MCKIILKFQEPLTFEEMKGHREFCEKGAGISVYGNGKFVEFKDMDHEAMFKKYEKAAIDSPFTLFHSRLPSQGPVIEKNIQPFSNSRFSFCHNGTVASDPLFYSLAAVGETMYGDESDSLLLFKLINRANFQTILTMLDKYDNNFVVIRESTAEIYIIGHFTYKIKAGKMYWCKNSYTDPKCIIKTGFDGFVREFWRDKRKVYQTYGRAWKNGEYLGNNFEQLGTEDEFDGAKWSNERSRYIKINEITGEEMSWDYTTRRWVVIEEKKRLDLKA